VRVERQTLIRSAATGQWTTRQETAFYASSIMLPAKTFASAIRNHWAIESAPQAHTRRRFVMN
jgi:predicted transposase YbfD/YdcC